MDMMMMSTEIRLKYNIIPYEDIFYQLNLKSGIKSGIKMYLWVLTGIVIPMSTHNVCFYGEISKRIP